MADSLVIRLSVGQTTLCKVADSQSGWISSGEEAAGLAARRRSASLAGPCPDIRHGAVSTHGRSLETATRVVAAHLGEDCWGRSGFLQFVSFSAANGKTVHPISSFDGFMTRADCITLSCSENLSPGTRAGMGLKTWPSLWPGQSHIYSQLGDRGTSHRHGRLTGDAQVPVGLPSLSRRLRRATTMRRTMARLGTAGFGDLRARAGYDLWLAVDCTHSAMGKAFSSMVYMIKALQSYALRMRSVLFPDRDLQDLQAAVHREMHASFLWLFQQVFSRTPPLMISVMLLFADFTVHSVGENLSPADFALLDNLALICIMQESSGSSTFDMPLRCPSPGPFSRLSPWSSPLSEPPTAVVGEDGCGGWGMRSMRISGEESSWEGGRRGSGLLWDRGIHEDSDEASGDGRSRCSSLSHSASAWGRTSRAAFSIETLKDRINSVVPSGTSVEEYNVERVALWDLLERTAKEMELKSGQPVVHLQLDQETIRQLVAPIQIVLEPDDYACFDRTDLQYQQALSKEPNNPLLLSNYAQFRYVVRHDITGAEELFSRAMKVDPTDGNIMARYASFLWLGCGDKSAADSAYQGAIASDPDNPYYTGSYAHFLWHAEEDDLLQPLSGTS